jgi:hypothetical protein
MGFKGPRVQISLPRPVFLKYQIGSCAAVDPLEPKKEFSVHRADSEGKIFSLKLFIFFEAKQLVIEIREVS